MAAAAASGAPTGASDPASRGESSLLQVRGLVVELGDRHRDRRRILHGIDLDVAAGETVAVVGESGSGKSTLGRAILGLAPAAQGTITYRGVDLTALRGRPARRARASMRVVFQDPFSSLNPARTVGYSLAQGLPRSTGDDSIGARLEQALAQVGLPASSAERYPAQFSGGQRQRIAIARALIGRPDLVICDEPVTALDLSVQAQILNLLVELKQKHRMAYVFVAHSIPVVRHLADRIVVMKDGRVVESGTAAQVVDDPQHPYTRNLLDAAPIPDPALQGRNRELIASRRER